MGIEANSGFNGGKASIGLAEYLKEREGVHEIAPGEYHAEIWMRPGIGGAELEDMLRDLVPGDTRFYVFGTSGFHRPETLEGHDSTTYNEREDSLLPDEFMPLMNMRGGKASCTITGIEDVWDPWHARDMETSEQIMPRLVLDTRDRGNGRSCDGLGRAAFYYDAFLAEDSYVGRFVTSSVENATPGVYLLYEVNNGVLLPVTDQSVIRWRSSIHGDRHIIQFDISGQAEELRNLQDFGDFYDERVALDEARADRTIRKYEEQLHRLIDEGSDPSWLDCRAL